MMITVANQEADLARFKGSKRSYPEVRLRLLGGFELSQGGDRIDLPAMAQRLVAFAAIHQRPMTRQSVAGTLWPELDEMRAFANLRSLLWRLRKRCGRLLESSQLAIEIAGNIDVDVPAVHRLANRLLESSATVDEAEADLGRLQEELLPDWYDDWIIVERERLRQICLHALESAAAILSSTGRHGPAVEAAMMAIKMEPFRESAHRVLISIHLAEGNDYEAARQFFLYSDMIRAELDAAPSPQMFQLATRIGRGEARTDHVDATRDGLPFLRWRSTVAKGSGS